MKAINLPKLVLILLCGSFLVFTSCGKSEIENIPSNNKEQQEQQEAQKKKAQEEADKKKKEQEQQEKQEELKLSVESLTVKIRERKTVNILNGEPPYKVFDNMTPVVSRIYGKDNFFTVEGIFKGSGNIKVEDSKGRKKLLFVTIIEENPSPLQVGKNKITVPYKDIAEVRILNGKGPYKHKIIGAQILQVSFSSDSILIAGSTRGSTKVEVTDGEGKVAVIEVTVQ